MTLRDTPKSSASFRSAGSLVPAAWVPEENPRSKRKVISRELVCVCLDPADRARLAAFPARFVILVEPFKLIIDKLWDNMVKR
jgi:hypothetical protein